MESKVINIRLSKELYERLKSYAKKTDRSVNKTVVRFINEQLNKKDDDK